MKASTVSAVFADLREQLVPIAQAITAQPPADDACLHQSFPTDKQTAFFTEVIRDFGFDFERGRCDISPHPFTTNFSVGDVRITVRYDEDDLGDALFSALHEAGHAHVRAGQQPRVRRAARSWAARRRACTRASRACGRTSSGAVAASGRTTIPSSRPSSRSNCNDVSLDTFYRAINKVQPSLIRIDADEVTYNLHVMLRFDFELALLEGKLAVRDLPEAWNERFKTDIGVTPPNDSDGVLQDVHWYGGLIGGVFQGYTLGNILGAQFYAEALKAHPGHPGGGRAGQIRRAARLAQGQHLPPGQQVHRAGTDRARDRRPAAHRTVHRVLEGEVRGAVRFVAFFRQD